MKLNRTNSVWNRNERNNINDNWNIIEQFIETRGESIFGSEILKEYLENNKFKPKMSVDTINKLPSSAEENEIRGVLADNSVYVYSKGNWNKIGTFNSAELQSLNDSFQSGISNINQSLDTIENVKEHVDNGLYYDEINVETFIDEETNTTCYIVKIPRLDKNNHLIPLKLGLAKDNLNQLEKPRDFAKRHNTTALINAGTFFSNGSPVGLFIKDGTILAENTTYDDRCILAFDNENTMNVYPPHTPGNTILSEGYTNAVTGFHQFIRNGKAIDDGYVKASNIGLRHPRQAIAKNLNGDIYFFSSAGRRNGEQGLTFADVQRILVDKGMDFAFMLDGGASTQTVIGSTLLNKLYETEDERPVPNYLYFGKDTEGVPADLSNIMSQVIAAKDKDLLKFDRQIAKNFNAIPRFEFGTINMTGNANEVRKATINFTNKFTSTPIVIASPLTGNPDIVSLATVSLPTINGFNVSVKRTTNEVTPVSWIAIGW